MDSYLEFSIVITIIIYFDAKIVPDLATGYLLSCPFGMFLWLFDNYFLCATSCSRPVL